ncbi:hypothetical protein [Mesorhizobium comanense]|uniref:hypothetical protein n=1 Tax=Mesorhizobium comanense TaxID=2502215 RepID=UPI0010F66B46|nr:hypothetical protein [Mesorhizobium comanense]
MSLTAIVFKSSLALEKGFPRYRFEREPISGECAVVYPDGAKLPWEAVIASEQWLGNIAGIDHLRSTIAGYLGKSSALQRLVLYSGSHCGDVIEDVSFSELEKELAFIDASPDEYVKEFAGHMRSLIGMARQEGNPIVFV